MSDPTTAEMIAWCEAGAAECDAEARDHADTPADVAAAKEEAAMLRAIAARLRQTSTGKSEPPPSFDAERRADE